MKHSAYSKTYTPQSYELFCCGTLGQAEGITSLEKSFDLGLLEPLTTAASSCFLTRYSSIKYSRNVAATRRWLPPANESKNKMHGLRAQSKKHLFLKIIHSQLNYLLKFLDKIPINLKQGNYCLIGSESCSDEDKAMTVVDAALLSTAAGISSSSLSASSFSTSSGTDTGWHKAI